MDVVKGRRLIRSIARWTLALLLFAQGALVANACLRLEASPQAAFTTSQMEGCDMGISNPNACLLAYLDQSDFSAPQPTVPPATYCFVAAPEVLAPTPPSETRASLTTPGRSPPIPIRYCTLLI